MDRKIITILIMGTVLTAGLIMGFGGYVFAGDPVPGLDITIEQIPGGRVSTKNYSSSLSNKSFGQVRKEVGDVLLGYGIGGADINKVTDALEGGGVYEAELKSFLIAIGMNEKDTQDILLEFDKLGVGTTGGIPQSAVNQELHRPPTSATIPQQPSAGEARENVKKEFGGLDSETKSGVFIKLGHLPGKRVAFRNSATKSLQDLKAAESKEQREDIRKELQANRETFQKSAETLRQDLRENAKELRNSFRENIRTTIGHVDHGRTGRIALAHGKGLRMVNRYRSAMARFDHILGRLESRIKKIGIESEAQARSQGTIKNLLPSAILLIEEAKNMQVENEAKLAQLETKYESLLEGENPQRVAEEARAIAKELKSEIEKLRGLLDDIRQAAGTINTTKSNTF